MRKRLEYRGKRPIFWMAHSVIPLLLLPVSNGPISAHEHTLPAYVKSLEPETHPAYADALDCASCQLTLALTDAATGKPLDGLVRLSDGVGNVVHLTELLNRGTGLPRKHAAGQWHVVLEPTKAVVPQRPLVIEALSGLETELLRTEIDLTGVKSFELTLPLTRFHRVANEGWHSGNTHLHLRTLTRERANDYLQSVSRADELELVFVSYLTRAGADHTYTSNIYREEDLERLSGHGVIFDWAVEHRHNFGPGGEGYGHVMFLNTRRLINPVSIGPGIMGEGTDWPPIRRGIDEARQDGATAVWCHNTLGHEDVPNWVAGALDAHNIFDGGSRGDYQDTFYRFMNIGLHVPFSTGTDWFIYDFSRVYVDTENPLSIESWLKALEKGKTFITNGPLLSFEVDGYGPGDVAQLDRPSDVNVVGQVVGRRDFQTIELIHNGRVAATAQSESVGGHFEGELNFTLSIDEPGWMALRVTSDKKTALGGELFGHTSAVYFELAGKTIFQRDVAELLVTDMQEAIKKIEEHAAFGDNMKREDVLKVYREGIATLRNRLTESED